MRARFFRITAVSLVVLSSVRAFAADESPVANCDGDAKPLERPSIVRTVPVADEENVPRDTAVSADLLLPNCGGGVDSATLTETSVTLTRESDGVRVPGAVNTSGGGDSIVFQPTERLSAEAWYRFDVTEAVADATGQPFLPFTMRFRTSKVSSQATDPRVRFQTPVVVFDGSNAANGGVGKTNCSLTFGPDGRLYAAGFDGILRRWTVAADGALSEPEEWNGLAGRVVIGLTFDSNPARRNHLWVTHNAPLPIGANAQDDFTGAVSRLTVSTERGDGFAVLREDYLVELPRSSRDHLSNSLAFHPTNGKLYLSQGSNTAMGAPDRGWSFRPERLLTAAVLEIDPTRTAGLPVNVRTENDDGSAFEGAYDPFSADAIVRIYATGVRNAFDLLWHSNGHLYTAVNGSASGGSAPASPPGVTPAIPEAIRIATQDDFLFDVVPGVYYGHPNPQRGEYVLNGGNPTAGPDFAEVVPEGEFAGYPVGVMPDGNYRRDKVVWNFGRNRSPNGMIEYLGGTFGGALQNRLLVVEYSGGDDILALGLDAQGKVVPNAVHVVAQALADPLDLVEHAQSGSLFVTHLLEEGRAGGRILLLRPCTNLRQAGCE